ncbi:MAG: hypothetical protein LUD78_10910 [Clostridiales bacterium]|nr:hypothetical protein [Clostridiales bacterium]
MVGFTPAPTFNATFEPAGICPLVQVVNDFSVLAVDGKIQLPSCPVSKPQAVNIRVKINLPFGEIQRAFVCLVAVPFCIFRQIQKVSDPHIHDFAGLVPSVFVRHLEREDVGAVAGERIAIFEGNAVHIVHSMGQ